METEQNHNEQNQKGPGENYKRVDRPLKKMLIYNLLGGIAWSLGVLIGTGIIFGIIAFIVSKIDFIPIIGQFMAKVIKSAQTYHP